MASKLRDIDFQIFNNTKQCDQNDPNWANCDGVRRVISALRYYHETTAFMHAGQELFVSFMQAKYSGYLDGIVHLINQHGPRLPDIRRQMLIHDGFAPCDLESCVMSGRHLSLQREDNGTTFELYRQSFDSVHWHLLHGSLTGDHVHPKQQIQLDLNMFAITTRCDPEHPDWASCQAVQRVIEALRYYTALANYNGANAHDVLSSFLDESYPGHRHDCAHLTGVHEPELQQIHEAMLDKYDFTPCDYKICILSRSAFHHRVFDSIHLYLLHLFPLQMQAMDGDGVGHGNEKENKSRLNFDLGVLERTHRLKEDNYVHTARHEIDFDIFTKTDHCNARFPEWEHCQGITRAVNALRYYQVMNPAESEAGREAFCAFIGESYKHFYNDIVHVTECHEAHLQHIYKALSSKYGFKVCDIKTCDMSGRHCGNRKQRTTRVDGKFAFYRQTYDSFHYYLCHLFPLGLRQLDDEDNEVAMDEEEKKKSEADDNYDVKHARKVAQMQRQTKDCREFFGRMETENNKFTLVRATFIDTLFDGAELHKKLIRKIENVVKFLRAEEFDTDAFGYDMASSGMDAIRMSSNVCRQAVSKKIIKHLWDKVSMDQRMFS